MTDIEFGITALRVIDAKPSQSGNRVRAAFDMSIAGIVVSGCALIEDPIGIVFVRGIIGKGLGGREIRVKIEDEALAKAITTRAAIVYHALTGRALRVG